MGIHNRKRLRGMRDRRRVSAIECKSPRECGENLLKNNDSHKQGEEKKCRYKMGNGFMILRFNKGL